MRVYLAVASRDAPIPPRFQEVVRSCADVVLFPESAPWHPRQWTSRSGRTQLLAWSNEPDDKRLLPPLREDGVRALGCPGYLGDPADLERLFRTDDIGGLADQLPGVFGVFRADQEGFTAVTTLTRFHPVYHATSGEVHLAGNRAVLVHLVDRLLGSPSTVDPVQAVRYDVPALQSLVRNGFFMSDDTPFEGVQALPPGSTLEVMRGSLRIIRRPIPQPETDGRGRVRKGLIRDLTDSVVKAASPLRPFSEPIMLQLTGGRDSRLIAAALHAADVPFYAATTGTPDHPDVVLAARIATLLGANHKVTARPKEPNANDRGGKHPLDRSWHRIRATEGMVSVHNNVGIPAAFCIAPVIAGWGGEQLRGGYLAMNFKKADRLPGASIMRRKVDALFTGSAAFLTAPANERAAADLARWAEHVGPDSARLLDLAYLHFRTGRWVSAFGAAKWATQIPMNPLLDNLVVRDFLGIQPQVRWSEQPFHAVISRLAPQLRDLPLQGTRWHYEAEKPFGPFARRGWSARYALSVVGERAAFDWRFQPSPAIVAMLREQIMDGPPQLFDIVHRRELDRLLSTSPLAPPKLAWHAYTASVLLSNAWLAPRPDHPPIRIPTPAPGMRPDMEGGGT